MNAFIVVHLDLSTGRQVELPKRFETQIEAAAHIVELRLRHPDRVYLVKLVPAA